MESEITPAHHSRYTRIGIVRHARQWVGCNTIPTPHDRISEITKRIARQLLAEKYRGVNRRVRKAHPQRVGRGAPTPFAKGLFPAGSGIAESAIDGWIGFGGDLAASARTRVQGADGLQAVERLRRRFALEGDERQSGS